MNFGPTGGMEVVFVLLIWLVPLTLLVWFVLTLTRMATSLREISERLASLENAVRDRRVER